MILIIEGPDRVGKSTLIKNLRTNLFKSHNTLMIHSSSPPRVEDKESWEFLHYSNVWRTVESASELDKFDAILDRFHLGATVYGPLYRNTTPNRIWSVDETISKNKDVRLILLTDQSNGWSRDDGDSNERSSAEYYHVTSAFIDSFNKSKIKTKLHIDVSNNGGFDNTYTTVKTFLEFAK